ncbi:DNA-directed RNA polymerase I subunit RPA2 isoform X2 [Halyomorpha halys]|uniref:DNA-directed RNA polymerase I subunit RPA2 isoform X2 n=1 Tax=Halyomorpha halys TaxID=286706 RepID=UPI0006D4C9D9|nr:DNA-directed RNA polymerase I subunit RPA2 [Halyomorpha halys]
MSKKQSLKNLTSNFGNPPEKQNEVLQSLGAPHVDSFNYMLETGFKNMPETLEPVEFVFQGSTLLFKINKVSLLPPAIPSNVVGVRKYLIYPTECRQRAATYSGRLVIEFHWEIDGIEQTPIVKDLGDLPIMVKSNACHLANLSPQQLIEHREHAEEWGGYFIVKGNEKVIRMLQLTRRNYPIAVKRSTWKQRGDSFSDLGVLMRCVQRDHTATTNVLHFVNDGTVKLMFSYQRVLYYAPLMLIVKCLVNTADLGIFKTLMDGYEDDQYMKGCIQDMLRSLHIEGIHSSKDARKFVGRTFKVKFYDMPPDWTDVDYCDYILRHCICIHLDSYRDKYNCLILMAQKLFSMVAGKARIEGVDGVMMQELLLGGHLYMMVLKEKLQNWLRSVKFNTLRRETRGFQLNHDKMSLILKKAGSIQGPFENFLATGNISSKTGLGLMQDKGLVVIAENINRMRYMSHFRAVHRGAFFKDMRTTEARQLLPDAWGFICPVHTPDGAPCGLLNHLTKDCQITKEPDEKLVSNLLQVLYSLGMEPYDFIPKLRNKLCYVIMLDGRVVGRVLQTYAGHFVHKLRVLKIRGERVPKTLEIVLVPKKDYPHQYPGLFLFTGPARMMRPVLNLATNQIELIGTFEQVYLDISVTPEEAYKGLTTHQELSKTTILSNVASLIPMPDCNQSPRNMYQCQMGKQTMGTPCHNWKYQSESKLYWLHTPASPFFRPTHYDLVNLDEFAMGVNAVIAVISYTGYDMEDAMIINKASLERGFAHGSIVKSEFIELKSAKSYFGLDPAKPQLTEFLGEDGLPFPGSKISYGQPYYCYFDHNVSKFIVGNFTGKEDVIVDNVKLCGMFPGGRDSVIAKACITFRIPRNPIVGDKFASRAGQKGICSLGYPQEDLPFTESGIVPDIIFNPHGFPSRMTIAMMIECMAGKAAAMHGEVYDATPFEFNEEKRAIDYFAESLQKGGYDYYGAEKMYSGIYGNEMEAHIFFGIVHYQRLRHMVSDKWQVRSTGPTDVVTRQPVKGRKRGGGVRFGEMERDSLISHGAAFLLQDRLFHCSDKTMALVCRTCGTVLGPLFIENTRVEDPNVEEVLKCKLCDSTGTIDKLEIPYIFKFLMVQLASVNIKLKIDLERHAF